MSCADTNELEDIERLRAMETAVFLLSRHNGRTLRVRSPFVDSRAPSLPRKKCTKALRMN